MSRPGRKNDRLLLVIVGLNTLMLLLNAVCYVRTSLRFEAVSAGAELVIAAVTQARRVMTKLEDSMEAERRPRRSWRELEEN